jgi:hypothetical protein
MVEIGYLFGLGVGKPQTALEAAYRFREQDSQCSIIWIPAVTSEGFELTYCEIGGKLKLRSDSVEDTIVRVQKLLSDTRKGSHIMIVDDINDCSRTSYLPPYNDMRSLLFTSILFTSRNVLLESELAETIIEVQPLNNVEGSSLLLSETKEDQMRDPESLADVAGLVDALGGLPLAISQAASYISRPGTSVRDF